MLNMTSVKNNLKTIITERGIKQKFLADKANISEQTLSNTINERYDVSLKIALQIARALDSTVDEIWSLEESEDISEN